MTLKQLECLQLLEATSKNFRGTSMGASPPKADHKSLVMEEALRPAPEVLSK